MKKESTTSVSIFTNMAQPQVGWIGLGSMGVGMAKNLQKYLSSVSAPSLMYTNRTISRGEPVKALGGIPVESVAEVTQKCDIIFSCVSLSISWCLETNGS